MNPLLLLWLCSCFFFLCVVDGAPRPLRNPLTRGGVTSLQLSPNGCIQVQVGSRLVWLVAGNNTNNLILFEDGPNNHAQLSSTYDPLHNEDLVSLGSLEVTMGITFDANASLYTSSSGCNGVLPQGPASCLWLYFPCITYSGNFHIHLARLKIQPESPSQCTRRHTAIPLYPSLPQSPL